MILRIFFCVVISLITVGCSSIDIPVENTTSQSSKFSQYAYIGALHNELLENSNKNFVGVERDSMSKEEKMDRVVDFNVGYVLSEDFGCENENTIDKEELVKHLKFYRNLVDPDKNIRYNKYDHRVLLKRSESELISKPVLNDTVMSVQDINCVQDYIIALKTQEIISEEGYFILDKLLFLMNQSEYGLISDYTLRIEIENLITMLDKIEDKETLDCVGPILSIAYYSLEWWGANPDASLPNSKVAPWVMADAAGAIEGAVGYALTNDQCNWRDAALSTLAGAALSSISLGTRVLKFMKNLF